MAEQGHVCTVVVNCPRCAVLEDLLETANHKVSLARDESDKADKEALHWKLVAQEKAANTTNGMLELCREWRERAEKAEATIQETLK